MAIRFEDMPPAMKEKAMKALEKQQKEEARRLVEKNRQEFRENYTKYRNQRCTRGGIRFDSVREANRYDELLVLLKEGSIRDLKLQFNILLQEGYMDISGGKVRAIHYRADFAYYELNDFGNWVFIVEDVKGFETKEYRLKKKMLKSRYGIDIREIRN